MSERNEYIKNTPDYDKRKRDTTKERNDTMAATAKPGAFVLNSNKSKEFFERKVSTSSDALKRFEERKPRAGIVTPFKK